MTGSEWKIEGKEDATDQSIHGRIGVFTEKFLYIQYM
jgi:hypothetical protein